MGTVGQWDATWLAKRTTWGVMSKVKIMRWPVSNQKGPLSSQTEQAKPTISGHVKPRV